MNLQEIENKYKELIDKALRYTEELNDPVHGVGHVKGVVKNTWLLLEKNLRIKRFAFYQHIGMMWEENMVKLVIV